MEEFEISDYSFSGHKPKITIRTDLETIPVRAGGSYDGKKTVNLLKEIEVRVGLRNGGEWEPYPSVFLVDGDDQLQTFCLTRESDSKEVLIFSSPDGVPDGELMSNAKEVGIYTDKFE